MLEFAAIVAVRIMLVAVVGSARSIGMCLAIHLLLLITSWCRLVLVDFSCSQNAEFSATRVNDLGGVNGIL